MQKSQKWWQKLFFWGLGISAVNSYLLKKLMHLQFLCRLVAQLVGDFRDTEPMNPPTSGTAERLNSLLNIIW